MAGRLATSPFANAFFDRAVLAIAAVFALAAATYAASFDSRDTETQLLARQQALEPPQLWQVDALSQTGAVIGSVFVCADTNLRDTFTRTRAEVNGEMCKDATGPVMKENGWALRCVAHGHPFAVSASTVGDPQRDFRLNFGLTEIYYFPEGTNPPPVSVRQSRHFHRIGACPYGWRIGDQAKPGRKPRHA
jgi:hypothetical protein